MTVDAVAQVMDKIKEDKSEVMRSGLHIPKLLVDEILQRSYSTDSEESRALIDVYINIHPNASWENLTRRLYGWMKLAAARESKTFMSTGKYCHCITYQCYHYTH